MKTSSLSETIKQLQHLQERELIKKIILPLLGRLGFDSIQERHGSIERGIDILCQKKDETGELDILAIQVKRFRFTGDVSTKNHLYPILTQLEQCLSEPVVLDDGTRRHANRAWCISPYELNQSALESGFQRLKESIARRIKVIDGVKLYRMLTDKCPELLVGIGDTYAAYINVMEKEIMRCQEARAFRLKDDKPLQNVYVDIDISFLSEGLQEIIEGEWNNNEQISWDKTVAKEQLVYWEAFKKSSQKLFGVWPASRMRVRNIGRRKKRFITEGSETRLLPNVIPTEHIVKMYAKIKPGALLKKVASQLKSELHVLRRDLVPFREGGLKGILRFSRFIKPIDELFNNSFVLDFLGLHKTPQWDGISRIQLGIKHILASRLNYQFVGDPGIGKTTLLRMIFYNEAHARTGRIPIFIPLSTIGENQDIERAIYTAAEKSGCSNLDRLITKGLAEGAVLLLFDGLDEAVSRCSDLKQQICQIMGKWRGNQVLITTRPWSAIRNDDRLVTARVLRFTPKQVHVFFRRWFEDDIKQSECIIRHLNTHPEIYSIIATPLVATAFAAIQLSGGTLPTSLQELYRERLRLLLSDWDTVKGVSRDKFKPDDKYFFLRKLAWRLHENNRITIPWKDLLELVQEIVGEVESPRQADLFLTELIQNNNVLIEAGNGLWGLGHLQYQEHLVALEARENPRAALGAHLGEGWWFNSLVMYAEITRDISDLIQYRIDSGRASYYAENTLAALLALAPNTEKALAIRVLNSQYAGAY